MTNESGSYFDWSADLTLDEFREMHTAFRAQMTSGLYAAPDWQKVIQPTIQAKTAQYRVDWVQYPESTCKCRNGKAAFDSPVHAGQLS
jgi:hypothetical protein